MKEIKIFIASSEELKHERQLFSEIALNLNSLLKSKEIKVILEKWEFLDSSMGVSHKQEEYNKVLRECNICIALFWAILGDYTKNEFETAQNEADKNTILKDVYLYFKNDFTNKEISKELSDFKQHCMANVVPSFDFCDDTKLTYLFITHIDDYCKTHYDTSIARIEDNKLMVEHKAFVDLGSTSNLRFSFS